MRYESDDIKYHKEQDALQRQWEAKCLRCGGCCGVCDADPCQYLEERGHGVYECTIYNERYGLRKTIHGKEFHCIPIREILQTSWPGKNQCAYTR